MSIGEGRKPRFTTSAISTQDLAYFSLMPRLCGLCAYILAEQASFEHPLKASAGVIDCIQLSMESILIHTLEKARFMVRRTTKNKACGSNPRATLYGRDIKTVLCILAGSHHILRGRLRMVGDPALSCQRLPSRDALRGNAHAKVRGKVKGKTPARAQALARAQER